MSELERPFRGTRVGLVIELQTPDGPVTLFGLQQNTGHRLYPLAPKEERLDREPAHLGTHRGQWIKPFLGQGGRFDDPLYVYVAAAPDDALSWLQRASRINRPSTVLAKHELR